MPTLSNALADDIIALIEGLVVEFDANNASYTQTITGYRWSQPGIDRLPAAVVMLPTYNRTSVDEAESQIGTRDYLFEFPVDFVFDIDNAAYTQELAIATVEAFTDAVDDSGGLAATVEDIKVTSAGPPDMDRDANRPLLRYPTVVEVLKFVDDH